MGRVRDWKEGLNVGLRWGIKGGLLATAWAVIIGALSSSGAFERRLGISLIELVTFYLVAGILIGIVIGAMLHLVRSEEGARVVGGIACILFYAGSMILVLPREQWFPLGVAGVLVGGWLTGAPIGAHYWHHRHD